MASNDKRDVRSGGGPVVRTTVAERVYEDIKERILDQTLKPGERLTVELLCRQVANSASPIRQHLEGGRRRLLSGPPVASAPDADGSSA
jgi:hypothetical protein